MGRPSLAEPRRRQIIDGLRAAIVKHGLAEASVQRIAAEADLPAGLVHHYFESKEDLLIAAVDQIVDDARGPIKAELDVLDPERALERALNFLFLELPTDRTSSILFAEIGVAALRRPQLRRRLADLTAYMIAELTALLDRLPDRARRHDDNVDLATMIICLLYGADDQLLADVDAIHLRRLRRLAGELVTRFRGVSDGKADARATAHDRRLRDSRARRRGADRRATPAR
ncbi:MAG: TetR family transcriptional regulator [Deltaproteobacteria bacterium]|nr:MAG: TetR family transcriptional regulator [Deltaproteobacteria bacterium]